MRRLVVLGFVVGLCASLLVAAPALGHPERPVQQSDDGVFPTRRDAGPSVVVCKPDSGQRLATMPSAVRARNEALLERCRFRHVQAAVDWVAAEGTPGTRILVLPGVYREEPSRRAHDELNGAPVGRPDLADTCAGIGDGSDQEAGSGAPVLSYEDQATCPHKDNLIAIHGDTTPGDGSNACDGNLCDLQLEGTGARPEDVVIDGKFTTFLNGIKGDRVSGLWIGNLTAQHFEFNGVYVLESDGTTIDDVVGRYNHEYGFLSFVSWVRYEDCEGYGNGDSAVYPGASPNVNQTKGLIPLHRDEMTFSTEVVGCRGHHNALGFSGTTGNSVFTHHNEFDHNATGFSHDSLFPDHPGTPQNHGLLEDNVFHSNNVNYYDQTAHRGICDDPLDQRDYEDGNVCPAIPLRVGTGIINPGGNFNWYHRNQIFDNWSNAAFQFWVPAEVREEGPDPDAHFRVECGPDGDQACPYEETSHWNTFSANRLAENLVQGTVQPNGVDWLWDGEGQGNCWDASGDDANTSAAGAVTTSIVEGMGVSVPFPDCDAGRETTYSPVTSIAAEAGCIEYDASSNPDPAGCDWLHTPPVPAGRGPDGPTLERLAGQDRVETAILSSREGYPTRATTVVLARADAYPDALAGAPLAHARGGPLLLTGRDGLDPRTATEIERLGATRVILLGGTEALSSQVEADVRARGFAADEVVRIAGADRFATAVEIARQLPATDVLLAKGIDEAGPGWVDALAASPVAALTERPILLTGTTSLPPATSAYLDAGEVEAVDVVGGPVAVSDAVVDDLRSRPTLDDVERVAGEDRYATSLALAEFALQLGADPTELWLSRGDDWPDGVAAGSAIAVDEGVMLLVSDRVAGSAVATWLNEVHPYLDDESDDSVRDVIERVRILGGPDAVDGIIDDELRAVYDAERGDARGDRSHGTTLRIGRFHPLPGADEAYADVTGYATMERQLDGTTRTRVMLQGLPTAEGSAHPVHVHSEPCSFRPVSDNPHVARDPDGPAMEPNEIHPRFGTGPGGTGLGDSTVAFHPRDDSLSVMVHAPTAAGGTMQLCADLR